MKAKIWDVKEAMKPISISELKRLMMDLETQTDICVRIRLLGKFWENSFHQVEALTGKGVTLFNPTSRQTMEIQDLQNVVQFEIDKKYQNFQPHYHYDVTWVPGH